MDYVHNFRRVVDDTVDLIASLPPEAWAVETRSEGWDTRTLVDHMIGACIEYVGGLRKTSAEMTPSPVDIGDGDTATLYQRAVEAAKHGAAFGLSDAQLPQAYQRATAALLSEWEQPGALEKTVYLSFAQMPGVMGVRVISAELMVHAWDLAQALGLPFALDEQVAASSLELMQQFYDPAQRGPGKPFGHPIPWPETAPIQERLLALSGRQPKPRSTPRPHLG